jgi:flagellar biosynthesis chaperone FliJ
MSKLKEEYEKLVKSFKELQKERSTYLQELTERRANKTVYERERQEYAAQAKGLKVEVKDLKTEITSRTGKIKEEIEANKKICEKLEAVELG